MGLQTLRIMARFVGYAAVDACIGERLLSIHVT